MGLQRSLPTPKIPQEFGGYIEYFPKKSSVAGFFQHLAGDKGRGPLAIRNPSTAKGFT
jgi:hypothetical protein